MSDVTLTVDGKEVTVPSGTLVIRAAEQLGIEIPRFCDHPLLDPVGACRQCYVELEGQRKLFTSCTTTVTPAMVVKTQATSDQVASAQRANLEFLLLNHPLDCPVCDRGGECPLQDQALAYGPGDSRFREAKRTYVKPLPLSPLVALDRERCVLCARCTRFCDQISGDRFIELFDRGAAEQVAIAPGEDFRSPFSGNTVQICPVGALTSTPYRFVARPFDLSYADSVCGHCSAGCNIRVDLRRDQIVRVLARDNLDVNDAWICDKGRHAFKHADSPSRITTPHIREHGLEPVSFGEALSTIAGWTEGARVAVLSGGRLMDEDAYALSKLTRTVLRTNDIDHRRDPGSWVQEVMAAAGPLNVSYADIERAKAILVVGLDAENEVPILHLRLRKAARKGAKIWILGPRITRLHDVAQHVLCLPGEEDSILSSADQPGSPLAQAFESLSSAAGDAVIVSTPLRTAAPASGQGSGIPVVARSGAKVAYVTRRAGDRGALRAGVHPSLLPGGRRFAVSEERAEVEAVWGPIQTDVEGRNWNEILEACAAREIDVLFLIGVDPLRDYPDSTLARHALENAARKVVVGTELGSLEPYADAFLPAAAWVERPGTVSDWEGRPQRVGAVRGAAGLSRPDWEIFAGLAAAAGGDLGFDTLQELRDEMDRLLSSRKPDVSGWYGGAGPAPPEVSSEQLILFTYPLLVDEGRLVQGADALKAALEDRAFVEIHPEDANKLGLIDGQDARITTQAGSAAVPVRLTDNVANGSAFVPFNNPGLAANTLLSGSWSTAARFEPVELAEPAPPQEATA